MGKLLERYRKIPVAARAALWFMIANVLQKGMSLITTPIFTRLMSREQYGQFSVYNSWLQIFTIFTTLRLNYAVFNKGMSQFREHRADYTSTMQTISFVIAGGMLLLYLPLRRYVNGLTELPTVIMIAMFLELMVTPSVDFWTLQKRYEYRYRQVVLRTVGFTLLNAAAGIGAVLIFPEKGYARILSCIAVNLVFGISLFTYNRRRAGTWFRTEYAQFALGFNLRLLPHYVSQYILDQFDRIMIQKMVGMASAGVYSVAYNAGMIMKIVTAALQSALIPWQYEQMEKKELRRLDDVLFIVYLLTAGVVLGFTAFAPELIRILADEKFYEAVQVIPPVALGLYFFFVYNTIANMEFYYNLTRFTSVISVVGAVLNVVLNDIGIRLFGYVAAAYTTMLCYLFFAGCHYIYTVRAMKALLKEKTVFRTGRLAALSAMVIVVGLGLTLSYPMPLVRYGFILVLLCLAYLRRDLLKATLKSVKAGKKKN